MVAWGHFSPSVAQHAMMLFERDLSLFADGKLDLEMIKSIGEKAAWMGDKYDNRGFWKMWLKKVHITATAFLVPLQTRGLEDFQLPIRLLRSSESSEIR